MRVLLLSSLFVVFCAEVFQPTDAAMTMEQLKDAGKMARKSCQPKTKAKTEDLNNLQKGNFAALGASPDMTLKCYTKCIHTMMQVMKKGRYDSDKAIAQMGKVLPVELREKAKNGVNKCRKSTDGMDDPCEISYAVTKCGFDVEPELFFFP